MKNPIDLKDLIHCMQGKMERLYKFAPRFIKLWRSIEQNMEDIFITKVFLESIHPILGEKELEHVNGSFIQIVHLLIKKEEFLVRSSLLKYTSFSSNKNNGKNPYSKEDDNSVNAVEPSHQDNSKDRKSFKDMYPLLVNTNQMF